jgi:hypothetical protein
VTEERILGSDIGRPLDLAPTAAWVREAAGDLVGQTLRLDTKLDTTTLASAVGDLAQAATWLGLAVQVIQRQLAEDPNLNAARWAETARVALESAGADLRDMAASIVEGEQL